MQIAGEKQHSRHKLTHDGKMNLFFRVFSISSNMFSKRFNVVFKVDVCDFVGRFENARFCSIFEEM